jgi:hypothetical protein
LFRNAERAALASSALRRGTGSDPLMLGVEPGWPGSEEATP